MSDIGSFIIAITFILALMLPACFFNSRDFAAVGKLAETDAAKREVSQISSFAAAPKTTAHYA
jgi:hypothetical protein